MSDLPLAVDEEMIIQGIAASGGVAMGKARIQKKVFPVFEGEKISHGNIPNHLKRFKDARAILSRKWKKMRDNETAKESKDILTAQLAIISDPELSAKIEDHIKDDLYPVQRAIEQSFSSYIDLLSKSGSKKMKNRLVDLTDIRNQLIEAVGEEESKKANITGSILLAEEFSPREIIQYSKEKVKGFVMEKGGHTSHAAIIARSMSIPTVVGAKEVIQHTANNQTICVNGNEGTVIINPTAKTREHIQSLPARRSAFTKETKTISQRPFETTDGHPFSLRANLEFPEELPHIKQFGAQGIGLLRSESMFLEKKGFGSIEEQISLYTKFLDQTDHHPVTIRLFDVGGDKFQVSKKMENNPYLGWRGVRMLLDERAVLRNQLNAILTVAGQYPGRVKLLVPTVSAVHEIVEVKEEVQKCQRTLQKQGTPIDADLPIGMMVEIPNAALHAGIFAREVDFFSLGTNDLTQYLLAVDRGNALISKLYEQRHPAVWKMIQHVTKAGPKHQTTVEICGELATFPVAAACLIGMGVSSLSMSPVNIPEVKRILTERSYKQMKILAKYVLRCEALDEVIVLFERWKNS